MSSKMQPTLRFLVDVDDTICDTMPAFIDVIEEVTGVRYSWEQFEPGRFESVMSREVEEAVWARINSSPGFVRELPDVIGCMDFLDQLRRLGDVVAVTSPHFGPYWMHERVQWLQARGFAKKDIIFASAKHLVQGDVFIDDNPGHVVQWAETHCVMNGGPRAVLIETPSTRTFSASGEGWRWHRAKSLYDVLLHAEAQCKLVPWRVRDKG